MNKDFNVYKWRREHLNENQNVTKNITGEFRDERSTQSKSMYDPKTKQDNVVKDYDGYFRIKTSDGYRGGNKKSYEDFGDIAEKAIDEKEYTFVGVSSVDFDDDGGRIRMYHDFYYLKPKSV